MSEEGCNGGKNFGPCLDGGLTLQETEEWRWRWREVADRRAEVEEGQAGGGGQWD